MYFVCLYLALQGHTIWRSWSAK